MTDCQSGHKLKPGKRLEYNSITMYSRLCGSTEYLYQTVFGLCHIMRCTVMIRPLDLLIFNFYCKKCQEYRVGKSVDS